MKRLLVLGLLVFGITISPVTVKADYINHGQSLSEVDPAHAQFYRDYGCTIGEFQDAVSEGVNRTVPSVSTGNVLSNKKGYYFDFSQGYVLNTESNCVHKYVCQGINKVTKPEDYAHYTACSSTSGHKLCGYCFR